MIEAADTVLAECSIPVQKLIGSDTQSIVVDLIPKDVLSKT